MGNSNSHQISKGEKEEEERVQFKGEEERGSI